MEQYLVIDLEFCRTDKYYAKLNKYYMSQEIIQIGAVILNTDNQVVDEFRTYVHPSYGMPDDKVTELTGITEDNLKDAPYLGRALRYMADWMGDRELIAASWSDSDYIQLSEEMNQKRISNQKIEALFDDWVDLQKAYIKMEGLTQQISLEKAMAASAVAVEGRLHDGAVDAFNTAKLISSIRQQEEKEIELEPMSEHAGYEEDMGLTLGSVFGNLKFE